MSEDKTFPNYGCHVDLGPDEAPDDCVLSYGVPQDCNLAWGGATMRPKRRVAHTCPYWRKVNL